MHLFACLAVALPLMAFAAVPLSIERDEHAQLFTQWKHKYEKEYETIAEEIARFNIWKDNLEKVMEHNARYDLGLETFYLGMNIFADMRGDEFVAQRNGYKAPLRAPVEDATPVDTPSLPSSVDWRDQGWVTPIKDQGQCGSCWSFSTTGGLEGQWKNSSGKLVSLSEEQLVDCDTSDYGCNGGNVNVATAYLIKHGSDSEADYPYTAGNGRSGSCKERSNSPVATVSSYTQLPYGNEAKLQEAVANVGPISVAIDASHYSFQLYSGGVYYEPRCSSYRLDHAVLTIGYGTMSGEDYWLVKNSWGTGWGDKGYINMSRNRNNNCGIASDAGHAVV